MREQMKIKVCPIIYYRIEPLNLFDFTMNLIENFIILLYSSFEIKTSC